MYELYRCITSCVVGVMLVGFLVMPFKPPTTTTHLHEVDARYHIRSIEETRLRFMELDGYVIVRNAYSTTLMNRFNRWCDKHYPEVERTHANAIHPKQRDKRIINDVMERMAEDDPKMLQELLGNPVLNKLLDALIGFAKIGAATAHRINPGGAAQQTHVDYPCHVRSGKFWRDDPALLERYFTREQRAFLKHFSVQTLIASTAMDSSNGATQFAPGSHLIPEIAIKVHDPDFVAEMEPRMIHARLEQGDVLIFSAQLLHRGGPNPSRAARDALIIQHVMLFGTQQHNANWSRIESAVSGDLRLRIHPPYPRDTTQAT